MLNVQCPECKYGLKLAKPKSGKFAPTCKSCKNRFQLLIKQMPDGSFKFKTAAFPTGNGQTKKQPDPSRKKRNIGKSDLAEQQSPNNLPSQNPDSSALLDQTQAKAAKTKISPQVSQTVQSDLSATAAEPQQAANLDATQAQSHTTGNTDFVIQGGAAPSSEIRLKDGQAVSSRRIGPYRLVKLLGEGGMGSVFLANQTTLDRLVALKVVRPHLASRPSLVARFTREAYAAAQLVHPNVVQIYDMGDYKGDCYFSMELVDGVSLSDLIRKQKKLDPEQAARYILHAARGLQCAHNAGMVHRDIKPANLLVNKDGVVKVADLGLVKVSDLEEIKGDVDQAAALSASTDLTQFGSAVGTPYYMSPEQAKNAVEVDHRADIYSLGCTLYVLLTGKRPFEGKSFQEVVSKHTAAPLVIPSKLVERVPESLSRIVAKMMAKQPADRYQDASELIGELEEFLGLPSAKAFTPSENDADSIEASAKAFNASPLLKLRGILPLGLFAASILIGLVMMFFSWRWATGFLLLPLVAATSYFVLSGMRDKGVLFEKSKEVLFRAGILAWIKFGFAAFLLIVSSFLIGAFFQWLVLAIVGVGLGAGLYFGIDLPIKGSRKEPLKKAKHLVRKMRLKGMDESTIQMFVAKYCGKHWEEFFEHLFSYTAKRKIRDELKQSELGKKKPRFRGWRDNAFDKLDARIESWDSDGERKHLQKVEEAGLVAQGVNADEAKEQASQMAMALVDHGDSIRVAALQKKLLELDPQVQRIKQRQRVKAMLEEARSGKYKKERSSFEKLAPVLNTFLGSFSRFLLGVILIFGCLIWAKQNGLLNKIATSTVNANINNSIDNQSASDIAGQSLSAVRSSLAAETESLNFPILGGMFYNFNPLAAGLILLASTIIFGWRMSIFALPAAFITMFGQSLGIPELIPLGINHVHITSILIGLGMFSLGVVFGRRES